MLNSLFAYWWLAAAASVVALFLVRRWAERKRESFVQGVLSETQSTFSGGTADIHAVTVVGTTEIDDELATLYEIEATISPTGESGAWAAADLFLYGIDEDGDEDRMRIGEVTRAEKIDGESFDSVRLSDKHEGTRRLKLSVRFAGSAGDVRFNYNFACFGPVFELPEAEVLVAS